MMASMTGRASAFLLGACSLVLPGCVFGPVHLESETRTMQVEHVAGTALGVHTNNGRVEITSEPGATEVRIVADLRAQTIDRLERTAVTASRDPDGTLRIGVDWADGRPLNSEGCSFDILVPDARGVDIQTGNGAVRLDDLGGDATVRTSNGRIEISDQGGAVNASTSNGAIGIASPAGPVQARSSNGSISVTDAPQGVDADTSNGRIVVSLTDDNPGPVRADSSNGRVELSVGRGFVGRLTLRTSNARISADQRLGSRSQMRMINIRNNSGTIEFGEGGAESSISTSNGAIEVRTR